MSEWKPGGAGHSIHSEGQARSQELLAKVFIALAPGSTNVIARWCPTTIEPQSFALNRIVGTKGGNIFSLEQMA